MTDERSGEVEKNQSTGDQSAPDHKDTRKTAQAAPRPREIGGQPGPEPTRYGDWEKNGRCSDF